MAITSIALGIGAKLAAVIFPAAPRLGSDRLQTRWGDYIGKAERVAGRSGSGGCSLDELRFGMREVHFERITGNRRISPSIN
jgi:hypothetical protein